MKFGLDDTTIEKLSKVFETNPKVDKALIFGSRAKGNYRDDSDIDIALKGYDVTLNDVLQLSAALEDEGISYKVDLVNYGTVKEQALVEHIDRVGIEVYTRWKEYKLSEITEPVKNPIIPSGDDDVRYIGLEHIGQGTLRLEGIGNSSDVTSGKFKFEANDILFGKLRPYFRKVVKPSLSGICSTDIWVFRAKSGFNQDFLFYFLANQQFIDTANGGEGGSRMPRADWNHLQHTVWSLPLYDEQVKIASILSSLDDKINLLHRQNKALETLAGALFRGWFVLNAEEHWEEGTLQDYIYLDPREQKAKGEQLFFDMKCLSNNSLAMAEGIYRDVSSATSFRNSDTLLAKITPCLENGKTAFVMNLQDDEVARGSTEFIVMRSKGMVSPYWIYCLARDEDFREKAIQSMTGTSGRQRVQTDLLKNIDVKMNEARMKEFHAAVFPYFQKIKANSKQIGLLSKLRDTLLPKLMSGEIRVLTQTQKVAQSA